MSSYSMDISGDVELSDYSNIYNYLNIIDKDDNFIIKINNNNKIDIDLINFMLKNKNFVINDTRYDNFGNYYIDAYKNI